MAEVVATVFGLALVGALGWLAVAVYRMEVKGGSGWYPLLVGVLAVALGVLASAAAGGTGGG